MFLLHANAVYSHEKLSVPLFSPVGGLGKKVRGSICQIIWHNIKIDSYSFSFYDMQSTKLFGWVARLGCAASLSSKDVARLIGRVAQQGCVAGLFGKVAW